MESDIARIGNGAIQQPQSAHESGLISERAAAVLFACYSENIMAGGDIYGFGALCRILNSEPKPFAIRAQRVGLKCLLLAYIKFNIQFFTPFPHRNHIVVGVTATS